MEKNALRAMEAGGRDSLAAAYEAMAAKEAVVAGGLWGVDWMTFPFDCRKTELAYINMCIYIYMHFSPGRERGTWALKCCVYPRRPEMMLSR